MAYCMTINIFLTAAYFDFQLVLFTFPSTSMSGPPEITGTSAVLFTMCVFLLIQANNKFSVKLMFN